MSDNMAQNGSGSDRVAEILDGHPEIESYQWKSEGEQVYVMLDGGKLAGRQFIDDMESAGMEVAFVDFATNRIGFSRERSR